MKDLDATDRKILTILSKEARIPMKALAARIGLSRSATTERVNALERSGTIKGYRADIGQIDQQMLSAYLMVMLNATPAAEVIDRLAHFPEVRRVCSLSGKVDLIVEVDAGSVAQLNALRDAIAAQEKVREVTTHLVLHRDIDRLG